MPPAKGKKSHLLRWVAAVTALLGLAAAGFLYYIGLFNGNVRTVVPGRVYRSALLPAGRLEQVIRQHGIRTVISLRGGDDSDGWFRDEKAVCDREGAQFRQIPLSATHLPRPWQLRRLLAYFDKTAYPVLFHCKGGADRSGLAATVYLHLYAGLPLDEAQHRGLTWRYGHFPLAARPMDQFFDLYRRDGAGMDLRSWIVQRYPAVYAAATGHRDQPVTQPKVAVAAP